MKKLGININETRFNILVLIFFSVVFKTLAQDICLSDLTFKDNIYYYKETPYSGKFDQKYKDGQILMSGQLINGKADSIWYYFKKNGKLKKTVSFKNGISTYIYDFHKVADFNEYNLSDFPYYEFYRDRTLKKHGYYFNGQKHGLWKEYYSNGAIKSEIEYVNGKEQYPYFAWGRDGNKYKVDSVDFVEKIEIKRKPVYYKTPYNILK